MTKEEWKEHKRANRRKKRQAEHQQRMAERHERISAQIAERDRKMFNRISIKVENGDHTDPTPFYAMKNITRRSYEEPEFI